MERYVRNEFGYFGYFLPQNKTIRFTILTLLITFIIEKTKQEEMMRNLFNTIPGKLVLVSICILLLFGGCTSTQGEGFAIYLIADDIPPEKMEALSHVDLADQPVISLQDIVSYNAQTHEIELTQSAYERICSLEVPVRGKSFMVCVDKQLIYWGAFWTPISSISFDGVTIWKPFGSEKTPVITLELGYPSSSFYGGEDPRNNPVIMRSLEETGKLINKLSIKDVEELPRSMKGYELYSWQENNQWHFTLITGSNRTKTIEEITSDENFISLAGWVKVHVVGEDAIIDVLRRVPEGESVSWCDELHIGQTINTDLRLPPEQIVDTIKKSAGEFGLDLMVTIH